ncbi:venom protein 302-like [Centruroides sculpturatus]|uniref:venom protein 302-like n=1 Tax=Centruroides sculpturatus TaxID=218467 RepID=UPI000C6D1890|nr:venom protein 302-like [Centruroides sculpturatus]
MYFLIYRKIIHSKVQKLKMKTLLFLILLAIFQCVCTLMCAPCEGKCSDPVGCKAGLTKDVCGCCYICAKSLNERCGGVWGGTGRCGRGLECVKRDRMLVGVCKSARKKRNYFLIN